VPPGKRHRVTKPDDLTEPTGQGQVWTVAGRRPRTALILDIAPVIERRDLIVCVLIRDPAELPENLSLFAVPISQPVDGVIAVSDITHFLKEHYTQYLGSVDQATLDQVKAAVRARFDL
jgi:mRNA-degrading endonuclease toxin of MazEF toxin-antitoxin module